MEWFTTTLSVTLSFALPISSKGSMVQVRPRSTNTVLLQQGLRHWRPRRVSNGSIKSQGAYVMKGIET